MPQLSVARRVLGRLVSRVEAIDGSASWNFDLFGRIERRHPTFNASQGWLPRLFVARRQGGGETRTTQPNTTNSNREVFFDCIGIVAPGCEAWDAAEDLLADIERALELPGDPYLYDPVLGLNLLSQELTLVDPLFPDLVEGFPGELVGVGVRCVWPHKYGDPTHVL